MSDQSPDLPVKITADEKAHPAIRKLARACIALARQLSTTKLPPSPSGDRPPTTSEEGNTHD